MPAIPKSPSTKRSGAPKAKGAVRAKSGCYTCRIRRKKCDEQPNDAGQCQTCVRLRLECLGFGAKRPEWLRESRNVVDLRDKIKSFLAAQGMIKGHSGSGPRSAEHETPTLRLAEDYSDSSDSPPTPTLTLSNDVRRHHHTSSMRDEAWTLAPLESSYNQSGLYPSTHVRSDSPYGGSSQGSIHDPYQQLSTINSSNSIVPSPAIISSFSPHYHQVYSADEYDLYTINSSNPDFIDLLRNPDMYITPDTVDDLVRHYMKDVVGIQYLLADTNIPAIIFETVKRHDHSYHAVSLLASVHWNRARHPSHPALENVEPRDHLISLRPLLGQKILSAEDAMAALHVVSSFLFDGGQGSWQQWLSVACRYVDFIFSQYHGPVDALMHSSPKEAFVIKTVIWFDVLASVTTQEKPHFLDAIRVMFHPRRSNVLDPSTPPPAQYSMMSPMGCENHVVWALAETSELSAWKRAQNNKGRLSIPELVYRGANIENLLWTTASEDLHDNNRSRRLAADIFRSSTRLYLRSVVSGDHPHVPEIEESVEDTIRNIQKISYGPLENSERQSIARSVVRSTVFSIFICGALADQPSHRQAVLEQLDRETGDGVGNCSSIRNLLQKVWESRTGRTRSDPVNWRDHLKASSMLLV